jgi:two-component system, cell cycle response regulator
MRVGQIGVAVARAPVVLIVSEHEWASRSLDTVLAPRGYAVLRAYNAEQALERARESNPDAIFIEQSLPDMSGVDLCRTLVESGVVTDVTPLLLTTSGPSSYDQRLEALRAGAWEVVSIPIDAEELLLRLDRYTRAKMEADRVRSDTMIDPETGLYSHTGILRRIREVTAAAERYNRPIACIVFEAGSGDEEATELTGALLAEIAGALRQATRRSDIIGRIGPTQFAIITPDTPEQGAEVVAARLRGYGGIRDTGTTRVRNRAGVYAVANAKDLALDPTELVIRAANASRGPGAPELN